MQLNPAIEPAFLREAPAKRVERFRGIGGRQSRLLVGRFFDRGDRPGGEAGGLGGGLERAQEFARIAHDWMAGTSRASTISP